MHASTGTRASRHWAEIDLLRGLAAGLMIANHAGVAWLGDTATGLDEALTYAGALAPVIFFTVTGIGRGVQASSTSAPRPFGDTLRKVLILLLADAAMWLSAGHVIGMDFLGFIAVSTLVLELVHRTRRPVLGTALAMLVTLALRFVAAPRLGLTEGTGLGLDAARLLFGNKGVDGFSYPLSPWLAYPLFGSLIGAATIYRSDYVRSSRRSLSVAMLVLGALGLALCWLLKQRGFDFWRWGTLTFAYTVFGFAAVVIGLGLVLAVAQAASPKVLATLSLPGAASFIVVPVHYAMVRIVSSALPSLVRPAFPLLMVATIVLALTLSKRIDRMLAKAPPTVRSYAVPWLWVATLLGLVAATLAAGSGAFARTAIVVTTQLLACALFVLSTPAKAKATLP